MVIYHIDMVILDIDMGDEANDMGDDRIDTVISHIDMGYLVTLGWAQSSQSIFRPHHAIIHIGRTFYIASNHFAKWKRRGVAPQKMPRWSSSFVVFGEIVQLGTREIHLFLFYFVLCNCIDVPSSCDSPGTTPRVMYVVGWCRSDR